MPGITDDHRRQGLYLAALGSKKLEDRLRNTTNDEELLAAWAHLGITKDMIQQARLRLGGTQKLLDYRDPEPCPFPPCPSYLERMINALLE